MTSAELLAKFVANTVKFFVFAVEFIMEASVSVLTLLFKIIAKKPSSNFIENKLSLSITIEFSFVETAVTSISPFVTFNVEPVTIAFDIVSVPKPYIPTGRNIANSPLFASRLEYASVEISTFLASSEIALIVEFSIFTVAELLAPSKPS